LALAALLAIVLWRAGGPGALRLPLLTSMPVQRPACAAPKVQRDAVHALAETTLASALRDAAHQDYRPAVPTATFAPGQRAYLTFRIASGSAGHASVYFCAPGTTVHGDLAVPSNAAGRYAQFSAAFSAANTGHGVAILSWDGQVAAVAPFTIMASSRR
jgi:hypothetical protein